MAEPLIRVGNRVLGPIPDCTDDSTCSQKQQTVGQPSSQPKDGRLEACPHDAAAFSKIALALSRHLRCSLWTEHHVLIPLQGVTRLYYLIKGTPRGEQVLFRGEHQILLMLAQEMRTTYPHSAVRVTDRPVDVFGNSLLERALFD